MKYGGFIMKNLMKVSCILIFIFAMLMFSCENGSEDSKLSGKIEIWAYTMPASDVTWPITIDSELEAKYSGKEKVSYQWKRDKVVVGSGDTHVPEFPGIYTVTVSRSGYKSKTSAPVTVEDNGAYYFVTFNPDNGSKEYTVRVSYREGENLLGDQFPATEPVKKNFSFDGWYYNDVEYFADTPIPDTITLTAKWLPNRTVTFNTDGGASVSPVTVGNGRPMGSQYPLTSKANFAFDGWYDGETEYTPDTPITGNITLKAKWAAPYTVSFDTGEGATTIADVRVPQNKAMGVLYPKDPFRKDYKFMGWFNNGTEYTSDAPTITGDITLTAEWEALPVYTVDFNLNYTGVVPPESVTGTEQDQIMLPNNLTRQYFTLTGWSKEAESGSALIANNLYFSEDVTLYAQWTFVGGTPYVDSNTGNLVHNYPMFTTGGNWNGTIDQNSGIASFTRGGIGYAFPQDTAQYKLSDYHVFQLTWYSPYGGSANTFLQYTFTNGSDVVSTNTSTGANGSQYPPFNATSSGAITENTATWLFDMRNVGTSGGIAINRWGDQQSVTNATQVQITKVEFIKRTPVTINFDTSADVSYTADTIAPIQAIVGLPIMPTIGAVTQNLPTPVNRPPDSRFVGWVLGETAVTNSTILTQTMVSAQNTITLKAKWGVSREPDSFTVDLSTTNVLTSHSTGGTSGDNVATVAAVEGGGIKITFSSADQRALFTFTTQQRNDLRDAISVSMTITGTASEGAYARVGLALNQGNWGVSNINTGLGSLTNSMTITFTKPFTGGAASDAATVGPSHLLFVNAAGGASSGTAGEFIITEIKFDLEY
jgi:uncharacterized repeat protein (TIGR02543 family)